MAHTHNYFYGTDNAVITITADHQDQAYDILCEIVKNPEMFKLFDSETVDRQNVVDIAEKDVMTTEKYWDCECDENYIHPRSQKICEECRAVAEDQPDSRVHEVLLAGFSLDTDRKDKRPKINLSGTDGNVFAIIGKVAETLRKAGLKDKADEFIAATLGCDGYKEVLKLVHKYVDVEKI